MDWKTACRLAADAISESTCLLIGTGAGMGVDSGLPDFRGDEGFWKAYPPFAKLGLSFSDVANPKWFFQVPHRAWGFYGHRYGLYSKTVPHEGFSILRNWCKDKNERCFVFTSNVDGHFQKAGFNASQIVECHGSLQHWQCVAACTDRIGELSDYVIDVDEATYLANDPLPVCPECGDLARPNVLMFGDHQWVEYRTQDQILRFNQWIREIANERLVVIEIGAGTAVPTVRWECEIQDGILIRINPRESETPPGGISIAGSALDSLREINQHLRHIQ